MYTVNKGTTQEKSKYQPSAPDPAASEVNGQTPIDLKAVQDQSIIMVLF